MSEATPDSPAQLPDVTLTASGSGREVNLRNLGVPAILILHGQDTADAALEVNKVVRRKYPAADQFFVASVIDLRPFPSMFRNMIQPALEKAYFSSSGKVPEGADPEDLVVLLPDWDGAVHVGLGIEGSTEQAAVVVADRNAGIVCVDQGDNPAEAALAAIEDLAGS
jgi:hypothetical protein